MSWFGGGKSNRDKHIKNLKKVQKIATIRPGALYRVDINTSTGPSPLFIELGPNFPNAPPRLYLDNPNKTHPLIDQSGTVRNLPSLKQWNGNKSDIAQIVQQCVNQIVGNPPQVRNYQPNNPNPIPPYGKPAPPSYQQHAKKNSDGGGGPAERVGHEVSPSIMNFNVPKDLFRDFPKLQNLSPEELQRLADDETALEDFAFEITSEMREMKKGFQQTVLELAKNNIKKKDEIVAMQQDCNELREEVDSQMQLFEDLRTRYTKVLDKFSPDRIRKEFDKKISELDKECEEIKEKFEGDIITHVTFIKKYQAKRVEYHMACVKKEKFVSAYCS